VEFIRFDDLARSLTHAPSRRGVFAGLASALVATLPLALIEDADAKKRRKKKGRGKKKKRKNRGSPPSGCTPRCDGRDCGDDGCGGSCGQCASNEVCDDGICLCAPACAPANACGPDGCRGSCGTCATNQTCTGTQLTRTECVSGVCTPVTTSCGANQRCFQNDCCTRSEAPTCRETNIPDGCGSIHPRNCFGFCCDGPDGDLICQVTDC
jgi:hypothetical protein